MRVIKDSVEIEVKCPGCKSVLGIAPEDVTDCSAVGTWATCPVCNKRIDLSLKAMSPLFRQRVDWDQ